MWLTVHADDDLIVTGTDGSPISMCAMSRA